MVLLRAELVRRSGRWANELCPVTGFGRLSPMHLGTRASRDASLLLNDLAPAVRRPVKKLGPTIRTHLGHEQLMSSGDSEIHGH